MTDPKSGRPASNDPAPSLSLEGARRRREREKLWAELEKAEVPLVQALAAAGHPVRSVSDLVNGPNDYDAVLPLLAEHLQLSYPERIREGIARALAVPASAQLYDFLVGAFEAETQFEVKFALALAITAATDKRTLPRTLALLADRSHGQERVGFMHVLRKVPRPQRLELLERFLEDPDLRIEAQRKLRRK